MTGFSFDDLNQKFNRVYGDNYPDQPEEWFWRVESVYHWDAEGRCIPSIYFERWAIYKRTPRGVWLVRYEDRNPRHEFEKRRCERSKKRVTHGTRKAWAYPTKDLAWKSFMIRQNRRIQHCKNALDAALAVTALAKSIDKDKMP